MPARDDLTTNRDLRRALLTVRRGTAFWLRQLNDLADDEFDEPSLLPGWTRRHLAAHVGYNGRAVHRLVQWANTGVETPMYASPEARAEEIHAGATLPVRALRHLNEHAAIALDVAWRDTPNDAWSHVVRTAQGRSVPLAESVWLRTREVWLHAIDLHNSAAMADVPDEVLTHLLDDVIGMWATRGTDPGFHIEVDELAEIRGAGANSESGISVVGSLSAVAQWATGRGGHLLSMGSEVTPPRWL